MKKIQGTGRNRTVFKVDREKGKLVQQNRSETKKDRKQRLPKIFSRSQVMKKAPKNSPLLTKTVNTF